MDVSNFTRIRKIHQATTPFKEEFLADDPLFVETEMDRFS